jgi:septum formation protein
LSFYDRVLKLRGEIEAMLILASGSPRRAELLRNAGIEFVVQPPEVAEVRREGEPAVEFARRLAAEKARAVATLHPNDVVLAADTVVVIPDAAKGEIVLGKPTDAADALAMLRALSGRWHEVTTGVCVIVPQQDSGAGKPGEEVAHETTRVQFEAVSDDDIRAYIATGEPMDKAGAYAIQGRASRWIPRIEGCYFNVMGLPVSLVYRMLRGTGAV